MHFAGRVLETPGLSEPGMMLKLQMRKNADKGANVNLKVVQKIKLFITGD
jgi:hypothetical protein